MRIGAVLGKAILGCDSVGALLSPQRQGQRTRTWMISTGRAEGQSGAWVRGYIRVYHEAASRSRPFSLGSTTCRGVPAEM